MKQQIELKFRLSRVAFAAYQSISSHQDLLTLLELFCDAMCYADYKNFSEWPPRPSQSPKQWARPHIAKAQVKKVAVKLDLAALQPVRKLQRYGLSLSWIVEEALFFGYKKGYLRFQKAA